MADKRTGYGGGNKGGDPTASPANAPGRMKNLRTAGVSDPYDLATGYANMPQAGGYTPPAGTALPQPDAGDGPSNAGSGPYAGDRGAGK